MTKVWLSEALIWSPEEEERVSGTVLPVMVGITFAFSEVICSPSFAVSAGFTCPVGRELHFVLLATPNYQRGFTSSTRELF